MDGRPFFCDMLIVHYNEFHMAIHCGCFSGVFRVIGALDTVSSG